MISLKTFGFFLFFVFMSASSEGRLYFLHIPKTGGTTLRLLLEQQLSTDEIYPFPNSYQANRPVQEDLVSGHFSYSFCKNMDPEFEDAFKVTILRDPVERYLSFLRAKKKADINLPDLESVLKLRMHPNTPYKDGLIDNALCRHLAANPLLQGKELLESAKQTLLSLDCVIFFDDYTQDVIDLFSRLRIALGAQEIPKINTTQKEPVDRKLLKQVKDINRLDIELYEYAKAHFQKKNTSYPLRTQSFEKLLQKTSDVDYTFDLPLNGKNWTYRDLTKDGVFYRWVMDHPSYIYFSLEKGSDYDLYIKAQPLTPSVLPRVRINKEEVELVQLDQELFSLYHGKIPKELITKEPIEISFYSSKAFEYKDIHPSPYNRNHPPLSFALSRIKISKQVEP